MTLKLFHGIELLQPQLGIPRLAFNGSGFFNLCVANSIDCHRPHNNVTSETEQFVIPGLPDKGPVSLFNRNADDRLERGGETSIRKHSCLDWLESKKPKSVLYICFGSLTRFSKTQISEIASALEESRHSFIWAQDWWLPEEYEDRLKNSGKGLIIKGWAPQLLILEHPAIGGFLTHCGWNSILEGICAGLPMVTWPIFAEQFYNEKLITQVLKVGVPVGNETWKVWANEESPLINRDKIEKAVRTVMGDTDEAMEMRKQASRLEAFAKMAIEEGGSSCNDLKALIEDIRTYKHATGRGESR
ncbi:hypothetical protein NC651_006102 [Populus alba x Populus x berolinensis]|nr:hypothetical protein NC651_006102 [Populus alba x Populus x berolinensis]